MVVHRGVLEGGPMKVFREGISLVINFWWQIRRLRVEYRELDQLRRCLFDWFIQHKVPPSVHSAKMKLKHLLYLYGIDIIYLDNSLEEVSEQLVVMYRECLQGDFSSVEIIQEANCRSARHLIRPNVVKANSSEVDGASQVFRQGIYLLVENLWVRDVFIRHCCHSNPHPMLQELAEDILFWFTQTIKPLSLAHLERILRNELYSLPINHYVAATNDITGEVATKLMLMHKECLQGNFSSVKILREGSLNQDKGMSEIIGVAPLAAAVPVVSEKIREERDKIRVERQKMREKDRMDKDAAMGKKRKITTDRDHDISKEIDLGYFSFTNEQGTKVYDERLFSQDTGMSSGFMLNPV
ncbi:SNW domain-containing protein 1 [Trifolium repens]|nr:SNW domain-containing protein 1 [Trifolium repens]